MKWTRNKPTQTGWYWYRNNDIQPAVIHVNISGSLSGYGDTRPYAFLPFMDYDQPLDAFPGEWCGPLPAPND